MRSSSIDLQITEYISPIYNPKIRIENFLLRSCTCAVPAPTCLVDVLSCALLCSLCFSCSCAPCYGCQSDVSWWSKQRDETGVWKLGGIGLNPRYEAIMKLDTQFYYKQALLPLKWSYCLFDSGCTRPQESLHVSPKSLTLRKTSRLLYNEYSDFRKALCFLCYRTHPLDKPIKSATLRCHGTGLHGESTGSPCPLAITLTHLYLPTGPGPFPFSEKINRNLFLIDRHT